MYQNKTITFDLMPESSLGKIAQIGEQLIAHHVTRLHEITLHAPGYPDLEQLHWTQLRDYVDDLQVATRCTIAW